MGGLRRRMLEWRLHAWHIGDYRTRAKLDDLSAHAWVEGMDQSSGDVEFLGGFGSCVRRFAENIKVEFGRVVEEIQYEGKPSAAQILRGSSQEEPSVTVSCRCAHGILVVLILSPVTSAALPCF